MVPHQQRQGTRVVVVGMADQDGVDRLARDAKDRLAGDFAVHAILSQPLGYAAVVGDDLGRTFQVIASRASSAATRGSGPWWAQFSQALPSKGPKSA